MLEALLLISTGLAIGFLVGLTGVGGGAIMTPALILGFNISPVVAIATDLLFATITKLSTVPLHNNQRSIDWRAARMVWAGSIPGVIVGVILILTFLQASYTVLSLILAFVLLLTSVSMLTTHDFKISSDLAPKVSIFGGGFIGLSVATTSIGAGALGMAIFRTLLGSKTTKNLVGTDIVHAIPVALIAGASYFSAGLVDLQLLLLLISGSIPGALIGSRLTSQLKADFLRTIVGVLLITAAVGLVAKTLIS